MLNKKDHSLTQKAMQMWLLTRALPFLLSNKIKEDDQYMQLILYLLRLMNLIFSPKIYHSTLPYVHQLTLDFLQYLHRVFPEVTWINKLHHALHYIECIAWSGPLVIYKCSRFEAKHNELKKRAQNVNNFKNPPKTLIRVTQCIQSLNWGSNKVLQNIEFSRSDRKDVKSTISSEDLVALGYCDDDLVLCVNSVKVDGIEYRINLFVVVEKSSVENNCLVHFGRIDEIIILENDQVYLKLIIFNTTHFDVDVNAYCIDINPENGYSFTNTSDLEFCYPFSPWKKLTSDNLFISLRHCIL